MLTRSWDITFKQWKLLAYNLLIQKHCRLVILIGMSAFLKPPFSEFWHKVRYLILGVPSQQTNLFWIFLSSKNVAFGTAVTKAVAVTYPGQS